MCMLLLHKYLSLIQVNKIEVSRCAQVDSTDIGCSDHYLVWMELGRATKTTRRGKCTCVIRKFEDKEVKLKYRNALEMTRMGL